MEERRVVTVFLEHGGQVALFRRSRAVGTYRGLWAGISGSVEAGLEPLDQVWQELKEETGLEFRDVKLICQGLPLEVTDAALGRKWVVYPFRLTVMEPEGIHLDWEHSEMRWVPPGEIKIYPTVPQLWEAWLRVAS